MDSVFVVFFLNLFLLLGLLITIAENGEKMAIRQCFSEEGGTDPSNGGSTGSCKAAAMAKACRQQFREQLQQ